MQKITRPFLTLLLFILPFVSQSQLNNLFPERVCGAGTVRTKLISRYPDLLIRQQKIRQAATQYLQAQRSARLIKPVTQIPVVFHVLYNNSQENISDAQLLSQLEVLNQDYRHKNPDTVKILPQFKKLASDTGIQFCLAQVDPAGSPTTGIIRRYTDSTAFSMNDMMKFTNRGGSDAWDTQRYLNIWVCNLNNQTLGYAQFPGGPANIDGVVLYYKAVGKFPANPNQSFTYNQGRTGTHEIGHWLGLEHIWGDSDTSCEDSDFIADTPNQEDANGGCPTGTKTSCNNGDKGGDMYQNFMDYTDDACMALFTANQGEYMYATINTARPRLLNSVVCAFPLRADFSASDTIIVNETRIQFNDNSIGLRATNWQWTFEGGTPGTSTLQNPLVEYKKPGTYTVTLTVTSGNYTDTKTKTNYILVTSIDPIIYPNPTTTGKVTVILSANYEVEKVSLLNSIGQEIWHGQPKNTVLELDLGSFAKGIYLFKIQLKGGKMVTKRILVL